MITKRLALFLLLFCLNFLTLQAQSTKAWTRWWWMGSAVSKAGIKAQLTAFQQAGIGGVEITPIYGVKGQEENFLPFLSPQYLEMLEYTTHLADSLGMGVDMVLGTGWPYGGPQVEPEHAAKRLEHQSFEVKAGETFDQVLNAQNPNSKLEAVVAYGQGDFYLNLGDKVQGDRLLWTADRDVKVYAVYEAKTGQKVKRAAPGGEGYTLDHYSRAAFTDYVVLYDEKLKASIRAIFNDSFEVYGADFTLGFFDVFEKLRGYDLKPYLNLLIEKVDSELANRVRSDYRETLGDLLKVEFDRPWTAWAHSKGFLTKLQAHGSPGNLLDLYASADIPECETFGSMPFDIPGLRREESDIRPGDADPMMLKFSSSAAHMTGKPLVSSETFTWLRDHFKTALSQTKPELEELFLSGINHIFLHGATYTDPQAEWPGWKFYASVNFSPQLSIWRDASALFNYIENCQRILQSGQPDNEIALYWPVYDNWAKYYEGNTFFQFKIHSLNEWLLETPFYRAGQKLMKEGYSLDFFSDEFLQGARVENGQIIFPGGSYQAVIVPEVAHMPIETLRKLLELKDSGGQVIFLGKPKSVPGHFDLEQRLTQLKKMNNAVEVSEDLLETLKAERIMAEMLVDSGLKFIRRKTEEGHSYFLVNHLAQYVDAFVPVNVKSDSYALFDPDTERTGLAQTRTVDGKTLVRIQLKAGKSLFIQTGKSGSTEKWVYWKASGTAKTISGPYQLSFLEGGPSIPAPQKLTELKSWTELNAEAEAFSGTAVYELSFDKPAGKSDAWLLQLPDVRESARIYLNDEYLGTLWANPFEIVLPELKDQDNRLRIEVTNLSANRIRALELSGKEWKIFHEINMVNKDYQPFDAKVWNPMPSGLIGELRIQGMNEDGVR
ncbi:glycoside hydrolase [Algoriphagus aestuariicola]|uniref:Glycoside hydrolase n=1 Tax=Algoriphagus aestuariicola TaxID=1852016 RepID=A0ABS3BPN2_9BACT|nr:glycosyl hydrolase [Algoriphagus aestuariicola]MBN7801250.1 glycoside hydrolase [Algoriphagus aestuariicola]